jgi:hypothetical protein
MRGSAVGGDGVPLRVDQRGAFVNRAGTTHQPITASWSRHESQ